MERNTISGSEVCAATEATASGIRKILPTARIIPLVHYANLAPAMPMPPLPLKAVIPPAMMDLRLY